MKIGFHSGAFFAHPLTEVIPRLAALGYQGIELNAQTFPLFGPHVTPELSAEGRAEIRHLAGDHAMELSSISAHNFSLVSLVDPDHRERQRHLDYIKGCIDLATDVGTDIVHVVAGHPPDGVSREQAWGWLLEGLATCIHYAAEQDVALALEAVVGSIVANMSDLSRLLADLGEDKLYVNFDPSHLVVADEDPAEWVKALGPLIVHLHVKDARKIPAGFEFPPLPEGTMRVTTEFEYLRLGKGVIDFGAMVGALREIGYEGFLSMEYEELFFGYKEDPWEVAVQTKSFLDNLLSIPDATC